jgi:hypothetical protein
MQREHWKQEIAIQSTGTTRRVKLYQKESNQPSIIGEGGNLLITRGPQESTNNQTTFNALPCDFITHAPLILSNGIGTRHSNPSLYSRELTSFNLATG